MRAGADARIDSVRSAHHHLHRCPDATTLSHSPHAVPVSVVDPWTPPPPRRLPPRPPRYHGRIFKFSSTLKGEYHVVQSVVSSLMALFRDLAQSSLDAV